jgi:ketosteroid isomerase-like protein
VVGRQQIRKTLERFLALRGSLTAKTVYSVENDDLVLLRGIFTLSYTDEDAKPQQMIAHSVEVAKRGSDGLLRFIIDHPVGAGQID